MEVQKKMLVNVGLHNFMKYESLQEIKVNSKCLEIAVTRRAHPCAYQEETSCCLFAVSKQFRLLKAPPPSYFVCQFLVIILQYKFNLQVLYCDSHTKYVLHIRISTAHKECC